MEDFERCVEEMLDIVEKMMSDNGLDASKYQISKAGIRDKETGVMLLIQNQGLGVLAEVVHPELDINKIKNRAVSLGYMAQEETAGGYVIYKKSEKELQELPDMVSIGIGIIYCHLYSAGRKEVLDNLLIFLKRIINQ